MKLIILKNNLVEALNSVDKAIGNNTNLPILKDVKLEAKNNNTIRLSTTDLELAIEHETSAKVIRKGEVVIKFSVLNNVVKNLISEKINLEKKGTQFNVSADNYEASINCDNPEEFPIIPSIHDRKKSIKINKEVLKNSLTKAVIATQYSEIRPEINGIYFSYSGQQLALVGTDSFRLVETIIKNGEPTSGFEGESFIIPLKTIENFLRVTDNEGEIELFIDPNQALFETSNQLIISRLVDGVFPDYKAVIPKESQMEVFIEREELINAIKITRVFSGQTNDILFEIDKSKKVLEISSIDNTLGKNRYRIPVKVKSKKGGISLVFNWKYFLDGLRVFDENEIVLGITEQDKPVVIKGAKNTNTTYVVMPIRS